MNTLTDGANSIARLDSAARAAMFGQATIDRMIRRNRGGDSGHKGVRFEHLFAAHRIARLARKLYEDGQDADLEWQAEEVVDDVVVRRDAFKSFKGYQLKNAKQVSWTSGTPSIANEAAPQTDE